jgi:hypothetical protein
MGALNYLSRNGREVIQEQAFAVEGRVGEGFHQSKVSALLFSSLLISRLKSLPTFDVGSMSLNSSCLQIFTVNERDFTEKISALSQERFQQVLEGIKLLPEPREVD